MFQAALFETMNTAFAPCRAAEFDLHGVQAEGAVAADRDHLPAGEGERRRHREGTPMPRQPKAPASM